MEHTEAEASTAGGHVVLLNGRVLKSPSGTTLVFPTATLAHLVAQEWDSQFEVIDRAQMHITALCCTAIDNPTGESIAERIDKLFPYFETDTIRFRDDTFPSFVELQVVPISLLGLGRSLGWALTAWARTRC